MIKKYFLLFISIVCSQFAYAQSNEMKGMIQDSISMRPVVFASVSAIRKTDSVLIKTTRTNQQGKFSLTGLPANNYILLVAHNAFVDYHQKLKRS